ncbi:MAG: hypothetical protein LAP38_18880 [Acidobacteriia bacterium]|nr:hypothetical protein [Terriglobia bacterium]
MNGTPSAPFPTTLLATAPAFQTQNGTGTGLASAYPSTGANQSTPISLTAPAHSGDTLLAYAVGLGPTNPATPTGKAPTIAATTTKPTLTVGGVSATVNSAVIPVGGVGVYQVNFTVPTGAQGTAPLRSRILAPSRPAPSEVCLQTDSAARPPTR